ncbi:MAG: hypothetical protein HQM10_08730 [Candidatus Riflebacteria bacterium]|nr:hypothetical protein [Candidatus Riflebacteria bacterium]
MRQKRHYFAFGIHIESEIPLSVEESTVVSEPDLSIKFSGNFPLTPRISSIESYEWSSDGDNGTFCMKIRESGYIEYRFSNNAFKLEVSCFGEHDIAEKDMSVFLMGIPLMIYFNLRGIPSIHGNVISFNNQGILITGNSGAGKSTLSAGMLSAGGKFVNDDLTPLIIRNGEAATLPGFGRLKIYPQSLKALNFDVESAPRIYSENFPEDKRWYIPNRKSNSESSDIVPIRAAYFLTERKTGISEPLITRLSPGKACIMLPHHILMERVFRKYLSRKYFEELLNFATLIPFYQVVLPEDICHTEKYANDILENSRQHFNNNQSSLC